MTPFELFLFFVAAAAGGAIGCVLFIAAAVIGIRIGSRMLKRFLDQ